MDFCCIAIGCSDHTKAVDDQGPPRICPRCNNAAVIAAKNKKWLEICCVPLVPMSSTHLWSCTICQWNSPREQGQWEPQIANAHSMPPQQQWQQGPPPGQHQFPPQAYGQQPQYQQSQQQYNQGPPPGGHQGPYQPTYMQGPPGKQ